MALFCYFKMNVHFFCLKNLLFMVNNFRKPWSSAQLFFPFSESTQTETRAALWNLMFCKIRHGMASLHGIKDLLFCRILEFLCLLKPNMREEKNKFNHLWSTFDPVWYFQDKFYIYFIWLMVNSFITFGCNV